MASVVLLHSALGLTAHVTDWAQALRDDGHDVVTPDMFGGLLFDDFGPAMEHVDSAGGAPAFVDVVLAQTRNLPGPHVYAGFSLGAAVAETLALTRPGAAGLVIMHGAMSPSWINVTVWPEGLRAQLHYARADAWAEPEENAAFMALAGDAAEEFVYEGDGHLFAFEGWREYDADAAERMFERVTDFLAEIDNDE